MATRYRSVAERAAALDEQRQKKRRDLYRKAKDRFEERARRSGAFMWGKDEKNRPVPTMDPNRLGMSVDKWHVVIRYSREDGSHLKGRDWREIEREVKGGNTKRKTVPNSTHIIPGVRALKNVGSGYLTELSNSRERLVDLESRIVSLSAGEDGYGDEAIRDAMAFAEAFKAIAIKGKQVAVKKILAKERMDEAIAMLSAILEMEERLRAAPSARACAKMVSVANRLGLWRDKGAIGNMVRSQGREASLRMRRDPWLLSQLMRYSEIPEVVAGYEKKDREKADVIRKVRDMVEGKAPRDSILRYIWAKSDLFRVESRQREGAERQIALMEEGVMPKEGLPKMDYLIGHYGWLYRHIKNEDDRKAMEKADYLLLFTESNKPGYMLSQLSENTDTYLVSTVEALTDALSDYRRAAYTDASRGFSEAAKRLHDVIRPGRTE